MYLTYNIKFGTISFGEYTKICFEFALQTREKFKLPAATKVLETVKFCLMKFLMRY